MSYRNLRSRKPSSPLQVLIGLVVGIGGVVLSGYVAYELFHFIFYTVCGYAIDTIPAGQWKPFIGLVIRIVVAWFGGIALPIWLFLVGAITSLKIGATIAD